MQDTIKVKLQTAAPGQYAGALDATRSVLGAQGPLGLYKVRGTRLPSWRGWPAGEQRGPRLWRHRYQAAPDVPPCCPPAQGMGAPLATVALFNAVLFGTWGALERVLGHPDGSPLTTGEQCLAGALAGIPVSLLATPTELLKCRLQAQAGRRPPPGKVYNLAEIQVRV